jgi:23S rRNA (uracil1939-C5)-methyltransferase
MRYFCCREKEKRKIILTDIAVTDYAAEGKALARVDGKVIFISGAVPGDVVDLFITKNKKDWAEARVEKIKQMSPERTAPFCKHFGVCGGCKWQMLPYHLQLQYKEQEALQNLKESESFHCPLLCPYWVQQQQSNTEINSNSHLVINGTYYLLKQHCQIPNNRVHWDIMHHGFFDKVIGIDECFLMDPVNNLIRNTVRAFALQNNYSFYDFRLHTGWLRNIVIRYSSKGELLVNMVFNYEEEKERVRLLNHLLEAVPAITSLVYTINAKWNDSIHDLTPQLYFGKGYIIEQLEGFQFKISPKSFFQTNTKQAEQLYRVAREFAGLSGQEIVYDLYCGTGSIGIF